MSLHSMSCMGGKKRGGLISEQTIEQYDRIINTSAVQRKGAKTPYTSLNGHMFSFLSQNGTLNLRLPVARREQFLAEHATELTVEYGAVMKEYVRVPSKLFSNVEALASDFARSYEYVASLKPKPAKS